MCDISVLGLARSMVAMGKILNTVVLAALAFVEGDILGKSILNTIL